jgi:hypothetical protein
MYKPGLTARLALFLPLPREGLVVAHLLIRRVCPKAVRRSREFRMRVRAMIDEAWLEI